MYGYVCTVSYACMYDCVCTHIFFPNNTPLVLTHTILKLQVAVHMRAASIENLVDTVASTPNTRQKTEPVSGTFQHTIGAVRDLLTNAMALTAGHAQV